MDRLNLIRRARGFWIAAALLGSLAACGETRSFGQAADPAAESSQATGFVNRVFQDATGKHKYVLFIPARYDRHAKWPVILYLHGAPERGSDGLVQTTVGLGPFVKQRAADFPFFVVFPQCEDTHGPILTEWSVSSLDGKRALAILDSVEREFAIDPHRRILTGWSMGGYGAWSLGAAEPKEWSAIAPVAGGGDPSWAPKLKDSRIWAFAGADDSVVRPAETRRMTEAIKAAGGNPYLTIVPNVGHDVWKIAYGDDRLYEWMLGRGSASPSAATSPGAVAGNGETGARQPARPELEGPFVPAVVVPGAISVRLGNDALKAVAHSVPQLIPADALSGAINDIFTSTETSGYTFSVQFSRISYAGQVARAYVRAYRQDHINIQLALSNVALTIGSTYVQGSGRSAVAGPISIMIGYRYPVWLSFDVTPFVDRGRLRLQLVGTRFEIPNDDWYVTAPYGVSTSGLGMTQERVSSGLVEGIYGQKYRLEQEALAIIPSLLARLEERLDLSEINQVANAFWPLPVYRPRLRVWPESVQVDDRGVSLVMGITAAAVDPRKAPASPAVLKSAGIDVGSIPHDTQLRVGIAPDVLEPLTRMLIQEDVARVNVLDIPDKAFARFADRKVLSQIFPDLASVSPNAEIRAELILGSPISVRDAKGESSGGVAADRMAQQSADGVRVTALKANADAKAGDKGPKSPKGDAPRAAGTNDPRDFEFVVPKAVISISMKDSPEAVRWHPYADLDFDLEQRAAAAVVRSGFSERRLRIDWAGEPLVKASARFAAGYTPKDAEIHTEKLGELFRSAWKGWTHNGPASLVTVPDADFHYSKLRLDGVEWAPPVLSVRFSEPGVKISNSSQIDLTYETKDIYSAWSRPITLKPGKSHEFKIADPLLFRRVAGDEAGQVYTLPVGSHCDFRSPAAGGSPNLFQMRDTVAASQ